MFVYITCMVYVLVQIKKDHLIKLIKQRYQSHVTWFDETDHFIQCVKRDMRIYGVYSTS